MMTDGKVHCLGEVHMKCCVVQGKRELEKTPPTAQPTSQGTPVDRGMWSSPEFVCHDACMFSELASLFP